MSPTVDFDAYYAVKGYDGVAFVLRGWATAWTPEEWVLDCTDDHEHDESCYLYGEPEEYERDDMVRAVMVGDDTEHLVDVEDLVVIDEEDFCHGCGQIGCGH